MFSAEYHRAEFAAISQDFGRDIFVDCMETLQHTGLAKKSNFLRDITRNT